ncbi:MAG TPA: efflux RND transporter permease subunit [Polyangia bacterium]|nr:efflux RND transporter permease subunit [Polyangia bacterium]
MSDRAADEQAAHGLAGVVARHGRGIALAVALVVGAGTLAFFSLPRGLYPELSFPRIAVVATLPDATSQIVLLNVTRPLEEALAPLLGVRRVRSKTIRGATELSLQFDPDTDMVTALQLVQARLADTRAELPPQTTLVTERITPTSFPVFTVNVDGAVPPSTLRDVALYQVRPALSRVPGVGPISVTAGEEREVEVEVDPARAEAAGLTLDDIGKRLADSNRFATVGRLDRAYRRYTVGLQGTALSVAALGDFVVGGGDRAPVRLGDVARISEGHADPRLVVRSARGPAAVVNVARRIGGDVIALDGELRAALGQLEKELPTGVTLTPVYQQARLIGDATGAVRDAILLGALLSAIVLFAFLRDARATLVAALAIPSSLVAACAVLLLFHGSLNLMSLGGLAIAVGLVIDDAVVVVEAIHRELGQGRAPRAAALAGVELLVGPVISSTVTTVVVFAPLAFLSGVVGTFFAALSLALAAAVLASMVIALTVIPLFAAALLQPQAHPPVEKLAPRYAGWLRGALRRRAFVPGAAVLVIGGGALASLAVETGFIPELDEGAYVLDYFTPIGTSLAEADALGQQIDAMLRDDPDVESFTRRLGAELGPPRATETSRGDIIVRLKAGRRRSVFDIMEEQRKLLATRLPGVRVELIQLLQDMLGDLEGNPEPIELKIFGDDEAELRRQAKRVADAIHDVAGLTDFFDGQVACSPERVLRLDPVAAGRSGLTTDAIATQLSAALLGAETTPLPEHDRLLPVRVRWPDAARFDERALERVRIKSAAGAWVPLVELGKLDDSCAPSEITRENLRLMVPVTARLEGRDLGSAITEVESRLRDLKLPRGYSLEIGGQRLSQREAFGALGAALAAAVALVLLVLVFQFGRFSAPVAILAATPVALAGGLAALAATRIALNVSSLLGAILLVGLVVKNGILLLHRAAEAEARGLPLDEALAEAGALRLRPILMTTLCTVVGLVPLALGLGSGAEMHRPLAVAVLGGLTLSTLGTLFVVPALYSIFRGKKVSR